MQQYINTVNINSRRIETDRKKNIQREIGQKGYWGVLGKQQRLWTNNFIFNVDPKKIILNMIKNLNYAVIRKKIKFLPI